VTPTLPEKLTAPVGPSLASIIPLLTGKALGKSFELIFTAPVSLPSAKAQVPATSAKPEMARLKAPLPSIWPLLIDAVTDAEPRPG
jgi:hypothetical protein